MMQNIFQAVRQTSDPAKYAIGGLALATAAYGGWKIYLHQQREYRLKHKIGFNPATDDIGFAIEVCDLCNQEREISRIF